MISKVLGHWGYCPDLSRMGADWPLIILEDGALEDEDEDEVVDGNF